MSPTPSARSEINQGKRNMTRRREARVPPNPPPCLWGGSRAQALRAAGTRGQAEGPMTMEQREDPPILQARSTPHPLPARSSVPEQGPTSLPLSPCPSPGTTSTWPQHRKMEESVNTKHKIPNTSIWTQLPSGQHHVSEMKAGAGEPECRASAWLCASGEKPSLSASLETESRHEILSWGEGL